MQNEAFNCIDWNDLKRISGDNASEQETLSGAGKR